MRLIALSGLLICSLAVTLRAANNEADRFLETAKNLIQAINSDDSAAIQASFDAQMQQALPPEKATPFFRGLVTAKGKLKKAGAPQVTGPTAIVRVTAERGAWDFKISLEPSGKIAGLLITEAAAEASAPASAQRFTKVANKLIQAINSDDSAAIQASFDAQMQQALPPDKATPFFRELVSATGKLKKAGVPQVTGPTAIVRVTAERGELDFKITLDASDKISGLYVTPPDSGPASRLDGRPAQPHPHAASVSRRVVRLLGRRQRKGQLPRRPRLASAAPPISLSKAPTTSLTKIPVAATKTTLFTGRKSWPQPPAPSSPRSTACPTTCQAP